MTVLEKLNALYQSVEFAAEAAEAAEAVYYEGIGNPVPEFDPSPISIAMNVAGLYATVDGLLAYIALKRMDAETSFIGLLEEIVSGEFEDMGLLCRFANTTWRAGQPFRGLNRITRATFAVYDSLPQFQQQKDAVQIVAAAKLLLEKLS